MSDEQSPRSSRAEIAITKRGEPMAGRPSLKKFVIRMGDVESPAADEADWQALKGSDDR